MRTILSAIALAAIGCLAPQAPVATADIQQSQATPQIPLSPAAATELSGATYCTANNPTQIDGTQVCLHITEDGAYNLTTAYLWEQGDCGTHGQPGTITFYPNDNTDLVLSDTPLGAPYTIEAYHMGDNLLLVTPTVTLQLNLINP